MVTPRQRIHQTALLILSLLPTALTQNNDRPNNNRPNNPQRPPPPFLGIDTLLSPNTIDEDRSHGIIFDLSTTPNSKALRVTDVEFYTITSQYGQDRASLEGKVIAYQIYGKEGTWHDAQTRDYTLLSAGNMTLKFEDDEPFVGYNKHRIPMKEESIRLNGNGTQYALYVGLSERILIFQHPDRTASGTSSTGVEYTYREGMDYIPLMETRDLTMYYGAGVMVYPLNKANHPVYFRKPRGFVGRIWYERDACEPSVVYWGECEKLANDDAAMREEEIEYGDTFYGGIGAVSLVEETTDGEGSGGGPTVSPAPSVDGDSIYLVITFGEMPRGKMMDSTAQSIFEKVLLDFYRDQNVLAINDVDLYSVKVWLQQYALPEETERDLQSNTDASIVQYRITVILTITNSALPQLITRDLMVKALIENESSFFKSLKLSPELTPYLQNTGSIASIQSIDELTKPPTVSPTYAPTIATTEPIVIREPTSPTVIAAILILTIYTCSILFSTCYIKRARNEMEHNRDQERLLKSTTIEPDIKGSKSDFEDKPLAEEKKKKKKKRINLFKKGAASTRNLMSSKNLMGGSKSNMSQDQSYDEEENSNVDRDDSRDEDSSEEEYSSEEDSSSEEESYVSEEESSSEEGSGLSIT